MNARRPDPDEDDDTPPPRHRMAPALLAVLGLLGVAALAYGTFAMGLWGGPSAAEQAAQAERDKAEAATALARRAEAAAKRNANAPMLSAAPAAASGGTAASAASAAAASLADVALAGDGAVAFSRAPGPARIEVLSLHAVAFGNAQRMLQFAIRASNTSGATAQFSSAAFRLVTATQSLAPVDKFEENVAPGASADGLVTFVLGATEKVQALRLVHGSESQDLGLTQ